jgi:hypothetical protein
MVPKVQAKTPAAEPKLMPLPPVVPGLAEVIVTVLVLEVEVLVMPTALSVVAPQALIAAQRLPAKVVVVGLAPYAYVPVNDGADPAQVADPRLPALVPLHPKTLVTGPLVVRTPAAEPKVVFATVNAPLLPRVAVISAPAGHALIAFTRFCAKPPTVWATT